MKLQFFLFLIPILCFGGFWDNDFPHAEKTALKSHKLIALFFSGSNWSKRSHKEEEIFQEKTFQELLQDSFVFCRLDFPKKLKKNKEGISNQKLKEKYGVKHFPSLVIVDPEYGAVTKIDYLPLSLPEWKEIFKQLKSDIFQIKKTYLSKEPQLSDLQNAYLKAKALHWDVFVDKLFEKGKQLDSGPFFLLEEYQLCLENGKYDHQKTKKLRREIASRDPKNIYGAHLKLAILDFQCLANQKRSSEKVVEPLLNYIQMFKKDRKNPWRLYLMASQYFVLQNQYEEALKYAREANKVCPHIVRKKILTTIKEIKKLIK